MSIVPEQIIMPDIVPPISEILSQRRISFFTLSTPFYVPWFSFEVEPGDIEKNYLRPTVSRNLFTISLASGGA